MAGRWRVARLAIGKTRVVEVDIAPIARSVAVRALAGIVIWRGLAAMTANAIGEASMVKRRLCPIIGVMAVGALAGIMVRWRDTAVAANTVRKTSMVKCHL
jgi:hypothetical protein